MKEKVSDYQHGDKIITKETSISGHGYKAGTVLTVSHIKNNRIYIKEGINYVLPEEVELFDREAEIKFTKEKIKKLNSELEALKTRAASLKKYKSDEEELADLILKAGKDKEKIAEILKKTGLKIRR
jgi:vacuolar-type H+-ATPase subunit I/STV1